MHGRRAHEAPSSDNFVAFDAGDPSPLFSQSAISYILSVSAFLSNEELAKLKSIELFILNKTTASIGGWEIPGLRGDVNIRGTTICNAYLRRFSPDHYPVMMDTFLASLDNASSEEDALKCTMPSWRVRLPNGDRYYPIAFHGEIESGWDHLRRGAEAHRTSLGHFENGCFRVLNGSGYKFMSIEIDSLEPRKIPRSW